MSKYDGWAIKSFVGKNPWLIPWYFFELRKDVIKDFDDVEGEGSWRKYRRGGTHKLVKVKLVEVA